MKLIVGLGNPGTQYQDTRHNAGFMALDILRNTLGIEDAWKLEKNALTCQTMIKEEKVLLAKPQTYMNLSGTSISELSRFYKIDPADIIVVYDDFDLALGTVRVRNAGGTAGHNGIQSMIHYLGTDRFLRIRIGIGNPDDPDFVAKIIPRHDYVLMPFTDFELKKLVPALTNASEMIIKMLEVGYSQFISKYYKES